MKKNELTQQERIILDKVMIDRPDLMARLKSQHVVFSFSSRIYRPSRISVLEGHTHRAILIDGIVPASVIVIHSDIDSPVTEAHCWINPSVGMATELGFNMTKRAKEMKTFVMQLMRNLTVRELSVMLRSVPKDFTGKPMYEVNTRKDFPILLSVLAGAVNIVTICPPKRY